MGTTLVAAVFAHGRAVIGHAGDSRCYLLRGGVLEALTVDHSYAEQVRREGAASRQLLSHLEHILTRCLDGETDLVADVRTVRCEPGDVYLLCSDGLWGSVADEAVRSILETADDARAGCKELVSAAWAGGGLDNIGVAIVRLGSNS